MKRVFIVIIAALSILAAESFCQEGGDIVPKFLIDGHFFTSRPEALPINCEMAFPPIKDKDGNKVSCLRYGNGASLSQWSKERAIPFEKVRNGKELLELARKATYIKMTTSKAEIAAGDTFPAFKEKDINGRIWKNSDLKGKCFLINFWNTGCKPCLAEMPALSALKEKYPGIIYLSATYNTAEQALPVIERREFNFTHLVGVGYPLLDLLGKGGYPLTVIVDKEGKVIHVESGTSPKQLYDIEQTLKNINK